MASVSATITAPVGVRNGISLMPNRPGDLKTIADLFDRIGSADGGTADVAGIWPSDRDTMIAEVTAQILLFQQRQNRPVKDGVVDPGGGSLKRMNQLAADPPAGAISAAVVPAPNALPEQMGPFGIYVAEPASLNGSGPLRMTIVNANYIRRLVRVEGSSITWFGVVLPDGGKWNKPHINFTPSPWQGGYYDPTYDSFGGWGKLWDDYTSVIGGQVAAACPDQLVIFPFYRNSQPSNLGSFLGNWREVITAVANVAIDSVDAYRLRKDYTFDSIVTSSFSNGYVPHMNFNARGAGVADATDFIFDLDGQAGGSTWRPPNGVIYLNKHGPASGSPVGGMHWYVGGRWGSDFMAPYKGVGFNSHAASRNHLLYHGIWLYCT